MFTETREVMQRFYLVGLISGCGLWLGAILGVVLPMERAAAAPGDLLFKLTAPDPQPGADFGEVLAAVDGDILVGEPRRLNLPLDAPGRAYLFDGRTGELRLTFNNPEATHLDGFAGALAGGDGRVFISTDGLEERVYTFDAQSGELLQRIDDPNGPPPGSRSGRTGFGSGIAYGSGSLLISAPSFTLGPELQNVGQSYLFAAGSSQLTHILENPEPHMNDVLGGGISLTVFGDKVTVGSISDNSFAGRVWIYDRNSGEVVFTLENPRPDTPPPQNLPDWFGWSVAANEELIVVGSDEDDSSGIEGSGTVYVFDSDNGTLLHTLFSPQLEANSEFGRSVAVTSDGNVLVSAWGMSVDGIEGAGRAYLFDGKTGNLLLDIPNPEPRAFAAFGWSVAALADRIVIGAPSSNADGLSSTGGVYVFANIPEPSRASLTTTFLAVALLGRRRLR